MSIASEITRLQTAKANIKTSIENKGVVVSSSDKLDNYSSLIDSINISTQVKTVNPQNYTKEITPDVGYRGLSKVVLDGVLVDSHDSYTSTTDDNVAYEKIVPSGALKYASLDKLGGMSEPSKNLLNIPDVAETTNNGITYKIKNGVIIMNGTASSGISLILVNNINIVNSNGLCAVLFVDTHNTNPTTNVEFNYKTAESSYYLQTRIDNGTYAQSIISRNLNADSNIITRLSMWIPNGTIFNNCVIKPMLVNGSTAPTEYQPYFSGIRDSAVVSVKSYGMNVWDEQWEIGGYNFSNGNTAVYNNRIRSKSTNYISVIPNSTIYIYCGDTNAKWCPFFYDKNYNYVGSIGNSYTDISYYTNTTYTVPSNAYYLRFYLTSVYGTTYNNDVCINLSSGANGTYKQYRGLIETKTIPAEVQALTGYGWGINDTCYNYIYYEIKKFIQNVSNYTLSLTDDVRLSSTAIITDGTNSFIRGYLSGIPLNKQNLNILMAELPTQSFSYWQGTYKEEFIGIDPNNGNVVFVVNTVKAGETLETLKAWLNGKVFYYELETPVETYISQYLNDNTIEIEENGTLVSNNTYEQKVPSEITYLVEV